VERVPVLSARILLDLLPIAAFALVGYGILSATEPQLRVRIVALTIVNATILIQVVLASVRFVLSPRTPSLRLVPLDDEGAHYAYIWCRRIAYTAVYGYFVPQAAYVLGIPTGTYLGLLKFAGLLVASMLVVLVLQNRRPIANRIRGGAPATAEEVQPGAETAPETPTFLTMRGFRNRLADVWHLLAILYILVIYGIWALDVHGGFAHEHGVGLLEHRTGAERPEAQAVGVTLADVGPVQRGAPDVDREGGDPMAERVQESRADQPQRGFHNQPDRLKIRWSTAQTTTITPSTT
jgi:small conductance mechanosensitive channel